MEFKSAFKVSFRQIERFNKQSALAQTNCNRYYNTIIDRKAKKLIPVVKSPSHNMVDEVADFVDAILNDEPTPISSQEGLRTVTACCATVEAAKSGETVKIVYPEI